MNDRQLWAKHDDASPEPKNPVGTGALTSYGAPYNAPRRAKRCTSDDRARDGDLDRTPAEVTTGGIHVTTAPQHHTRTARRYSQLLALAATAAIVVTGAGCSKSSKDNKAAPTSPSPSASPTASADPQAAEKKNVLAAYDGFWAESVKAYATGTEKGTRLVDFAAKGALDRTLADIASMQKAGIAKQGGPGHRPETTALNLSGERPTATVTDCLDLSTWQTVERATGTVRPYPSAQPMRYVAVAEIEQWAGRWMVVKMTPNGDNKC
ncbi:hypothetical protein [Streptomyces sp. R33]|uniref:Secreted protein/lipoprotein n=1 Tax=Streptomyces sp. R33 TaxID=3238629 RepID=A0AB39XUS7_9ACTN